MNWNKLGCIYKPDGSVGWKRTHAANPVAEHVTGDIYRIYFSARAEDNRASIGCIEIDITNPFQVIDEPNEPVLEIGEIGCFDDSGVSMGCLVSRANKRYLFYLGWNLGVTVPWRNSIGLAISEDGGPFIRVSKAPVLDRNRYDPYSISYPFILVENDKWRMWYGSNKSWGKSQEDMAHLLKYAESDDGINWFPTGEISVNFQNDNEYAMSKPSVLKEDGIYKMWYSYRGKAYRIGYAESSNGIHFVRKDQLAGITVSDIGWDSETVEYPNVFVHKGIKYMLYNGNKYGLTGIGLAVLE